MVDHQHVVPVAGHVAQATEPVHARNIHGHNKIDVSTHGIRIDQKLPPGQRPQRFRERGRCRKADLDGLTAPVQHQRQRQTRADRVGIGMHMTDHPDRCRGIENFGRADGVDPLCRSGFSL